MDLLLKGKLEILYQLCDVYYDYAKTSTSELNLTSNQLRDICATELQAFAIVISSQYGRINSSEIDCINYYFDENWNYDLDKSRVARIVGDFEQYLLDSNWIALSGIIILDNILFANSNKKDSFATSTYLGVLKDLKNEILNCTSRSQLDPHRVSVANHYMNIVKNIVKEKHLFPYGVDGLYEDDSYEDYYHDMGLDFSNNNQLISDQIEKIYTPIFEEPIESLDDLLLQLNTLVGISNIKSDVSSIVNLIKVNKLRKERGISVAPMSLHMVFSGNPGTGKTTVARLLGKIYKSLGVLSKGHLVEVDRSGLVGGYVGQTALKVQDVIKSALGGILFIDEAYSLVNKGNNDYGAEAIDTLVKGMEDYRNDLIIIVAGYPDLMEDFLNSNPGLRSRFNKFFNFQDYSPVELLEIFESMVKEKGYKLSSMAILYAKQYFHNQFNHKDTVCQNARGVRNFLEKAIVNQANRLSSLTSDLSDDLLMTIELSDISSIK